MKKLLLALLLVWHSESFYTQFQAVEYLNKISPTAKQVQIVMDKDMFYIFWCEEK